jgi:FtsP/CotA-like multicopper oxidase with cupredoxin domain
MSEGTLMTRRLRPRLIALALVALATIAGVAAAASTQSFSVELRGGRAKGDDTLKVRQGDQVQVRFSSDQPVVLHLHGYDIDAKVTPPTPALMSFKANLAGRFPVHEHREGAGNHRAVLFIEVHP